MGKPISNYNHNGRFEFLCNDPEYKRLLTGDDYDETDTEKIRKIIVIATQARIPRETIIRIRTKFDAFIDDPEKRFMKRLGLNYADHVITYNIASKAYMVNGYSESEWRMMVDDEFFPSYSHVRKFIFRCLKKNDTHALQMLEAKFGASFCDRKEQILLDHGLPIDTKFQSLTTTHIDGMTFTMWRMLNDSEFCPTKPMLVSAIFLLKSKNRFSEVKNLENKYFELLYPDKLPSVTQEEIDEAADYFKHLLD